MFYRSGRGLFPKRRPRKLLKFSCPHLLAEGGTKGVLKSWTNRCYSKIGQIFYAQSKVYFCNWRSDVRHRQRNRMASTAMILKSKGYKTTCVKIDPYLNVD